MKSFFAIVLLLSSHALFAQKDSIAPGYLRNPTVPPFRLLQVDSSSYFTKADLKKKKAVLIILFDPSCEHCKHETEAILNNIDSFKNVEIVMATNASFDKMKEFYEHFGLANVRNIHVGIDYQTILAPFYMIRNLPYLAMYDRKGNLISTFEGTMKIEKLVAMFR
jgi:thioredoxin-related protein